MASAHTSSALSRRSFVKLSLTGSLVAATGFPFRAAYGAAEDAPEVWILNGSDRRELMQQACRIIRDNGGLGPQVKTLSLKINSAWARKPEVGANTHPALVNEFIKQCKSADVSEVVLPENPCDNPRWAFTRPGTKEAVEDAGGELINLRDQKNSFREQNIPDGKSLKNAQVAKQFFETDTVINMPVAKHHGGTGLTIGMKNWMGAVKDRGFWHRNNLHQCIADFTSLLKADWTIVDATTFMPDSGPKGPSSNLKEPEKLIVSRSPVAADAVTASKVAGKSPSDVGFLRHAQEMELGVIDVNAMNIHRVEVG